MDARFDAVVHPNYIHIKHPPGFEITPAFLDDAWAEVARLAREHACNKILIEAPGPIRQLDTMSAFDSGRTLAEIAPGLAVAMCFEDYSFDDISAFFKTVAQNRGAKVEMFSNRDDALAWLGVKANSERAGRK